MGRYVITDEAGTPSGRFVIGPERSEHTESFSQGYFAQGPGASFVDRLGMSFKMTPEGQAAFLTERGYPGVAAYPEGVAFRDPSGRMTLANPRGADLGDVAGVVADVPTVAGAAVGAGLTGGNPLGAAYGGASGAALKQIVGKMLPGDESVSPINRAGAFALEGLWTGLGQGATNAAAGAVGLPKNILARITQKSLATPEAKVGEAVAARVGPLSLGQTTMSPGQIAIEDISRVHPFGRDTWREFFGKQIDAAKGKLENTLKSLHQSQQTPIGFGRRVETDFDNALEAAVNVRRQVAGRDFAAVAAATNNKPAFSASNTVGVIDDMIARNDVPGGGDATAQLVAHLKKLRAEFTETPAQPSTVLNQYGQPAAVTPPQMRQLSANELERLLEVWGKKAARNLAPFADLDAAQQRGISAQVFKALNLDLDAAASSAQGPAAQALRLARDNYRANSQGIDTLRESVIGRYFGSPNNRTPERTSEMILNMRPSEIAETWQVLRRADPELAGATRRHILESAMEKATRAAETQISKQGRPGQFDIAAFIKAMPSGKKFDAIYGGSVSESDLRVIAEYLRRASIGVAEGSQTGGRALAWDVAKGLFTLNPVTLTGGAISALTPGQVAKASLTPQGRKALITLSQKNVPARVASAAVADLIGFGVVGGGE